MITHRLAIPLIGYCWSVFLAVWFIAAFNAKPTRERWSTAAGFGYFATGALIWWLFTRSDLWGEILLVGHGPAASLAGVATTVAGLFVTIWARVTLGRNWSGSITFKQDHELVERGPYRFVRHPIYTGLLLMALGTAVVRGNPDSFLGVVVFLVAHIWKLRREEELLQRHFPDSYPAYRDRTRALIPFLY
jgi:protein-S-isoprenylcysteine O-methyltransferase Ste14